MEVLPHSDDGRQIRRRLGWPGQPGTGEVAAEVRHYLATLRAKQVTLPDDLRMVNGPDGLEMRHRRVDGTALTELPGSQAAEFVTAVRRVGDWVNRLHDSEARLDPSLAGFVLDRGANLTYVKVVPPLLTTRRPVETTPWRQILGALRYDRNVTLCAMAGYAARHLLRTLEPGEPLTTHGAAVIALCPGHPRPSTRPAMWFHARTRAAELALTGRIAAQQAMAVYAATSLLVLRGIPPSDQRAHIEVALAAAAALSRDSSGKAPRM
ncbi:hypothetical protein DP939_36480 [Spongiactinospora rosea]|uniref:Uncharacterized protein n=2 Tax=Spongiactinospora rosea TaxID=2248750 RepID=A0A366LNW6_9ACTN|nr:hypothetical protein DP939_36480 [Spongiactinospora rosea]